MHTSFLQSQGWEEFQKSVGYQTFRVDSALLIKKSLFFGKSYFYAPRAGTSNGERVTGNFIDDIIQLAKKENCIFLRIEPSAALPAIHYPLRKVADVQPSQTIILNLEKSEEELLAQMHPKTRYNIRLAEKKAVTVRTVETRHGASEDFEKFWELMEETVGRDKFRSHGKEYYKTMLDSLDISIPTAPASSPPRRPAGSKEGNDGNKLSVRLYFAEYENKILTAEERRKKLEFELFEELRAQILKEVSKILHVAHRLATLDVLCLTPMPLLIFTALPRMSVKK